MSVKMVDVLVEHIGDGYTVIVWANPGLEKKLYSVDGVYAVYVENTGEPKYSVYIDKRYSLPSVVAEIENKLKEGK